MKKNYIATFSQFILEQDFGTPPMGATPVPPKEKPVQFLFMDESEYDELNKKKYPDGSISMDFPCYSATPTQIADWTKKNIIATDKNKLSDITLELRKKNILGITKGDKVNISTDDVPFVEKLKNAVASDIFGTREPDVTVIFTKEGIPTTDNVAVTFIKYDSNA